ncbi:dihydroneopterin aldolase [Ornithinimicrobium sp. INDO-MA30-4]|uniref:dihydroneopterin aldolase n=1 Tax=Ornithinimicrobium sp. INDO-MA30-4 TaxID=2908651 RepID=UPI001F1FFEA1|nr:dihydroneopterin aldolase [Ornithinimicrobium sp. INDO-MA30-4]UJH70497.1 dihydroneopterin aldolase [Ornithinimicrobium sp. INDO-MA30-4]
MVDAIWLRGVKAYGHHGVLDFEKEQGQDFIVDIDLDVDLSSAAATDDLSHTVNYAEVAAVAVQVIEGPSFDLIEAVAGKIGDQVLAAQPWCSRSRSPCTSRKRQSASPSPMLPWPSRVDATCPS